MELIAEKHKRQLIELLRSNDKSIGATARSYVISTLAGKWPEEMLRIAFMPGIEDSKWMLQCAAKALAASHPASHANWGITLDDDVLRAAFLTSLFTEWWQIQPRDFESWIDARADRDRLHAYSPLNPMNYRQLHFTSFDQGIRQINALAFENISFDAVERTVKELLNLSGGEADAATLVSKISDPGWRDAILSQAAAMNGAERMGEAIQLLQGMSDPVSRSRLASTIAARMSLEDERAAVDFANSLPSERERLLAHASIKSTRASQRSR